MRKFDKCGKNAEIIDTFYG